VCSFIAVNSPVHEIQRHVCYSHLNLESFKKRTEHCVVVTCYMTFLLNAINIVHLLQKLFEYTDRAHMGTHSIQGHVRLFCFRKPV